MTVCNPSWEILPLIGVGPIRFEMLDSEVAAIFGVRAYSELKYTSSPGLPPSLEESIHSWRFPWYFGCEFDAGNRLICIIIRTNCYTENKILLGGNPVYDQPIESTLGWLREKDPETEVSFCSVTSERLGIEFQSRGFAISWAENKPAGWDEKYDRRPLRIRLLSPRYLEHDRRALAEGRKKYANKPQPRQPRVPMTEVGSHPWLPERWDIVPWERVGDLVFGMKRSEVLEVLAPPTEAFWPEVIPEAESAHLPMDVWAEKFRIPRGVIGDFQIKCYYWARTSRLHRVEFYFNEHHYNWFRIEYAGKNLIEYDSMQLYALLQEQSNDTRDEYYGFYSAGLGIGVYQRQVYDFLDVKPEQISQFWERYELGFPHGIILWSDVGDDWEPGMPMRRSSTGGR